MSFKQIKNSLFRLIGSVRYSKWFHLLLSALVIVIFGFLFWQVGKIYRSFLVEQEKYKMQTRLNDIGNSLTFAIFRRQLLLNGLSAFAKSYSLYHLTEREFSFYAAGLQANDPVIRAVQFFPAEGTVLVYPEENNETTIGRTLSDLIHDERPNVREDVSRTIESGEITLSDPYILRQGGKGFIARLAVYEQDELLGIVVVVLNLDPLLEIPVLNGERSEYSYVLQDSSDHIFFGEEEILAQDPVRYSVALPEGSWTLSAAPRESWAAILKTETMIYGVITSLFTLLVSFLTFFMMRVQTSLSEQLNAQSQELLKSSKQLALAVEAAEIGFFDWDLRTNEVHYSPEWKRLIGYEEDEITGDLSEWKERVHPEDLQSALAIEYECIENRRPKYEVEFRFRHKNGSFLNILSRGLLHTNSNKEPVRMLGCHIDITNQKLNEMALSASEIRFRGLAESIQDSILLYDRQIKIVYMNPAAYRLFASKEEDLSAGSMPYDEFGSEKMHELELDIMQIFSKKNSIQRTMQWERSGGRLVLDWRLTPVSNENEDVELVLAISRDITAQQSAEDALRESEVHFRNLADSGQALIWTSVVSKYGDYFNKPWLDFTGRRFEDELGFGWTDNIHPDDFQRVMETYSTCFDHREKFSMDYRLRCSEGVYRWIQDDGSPRFNSKGQFIGYINHCLDITNRKRIEDQLNHAQIELQKMLAEADETRQVLLSVIEDQKIAEEKINQLNMELEMRVRERTLQLEATNKELEAFSYSVSHDLRAPLRGIDGWSLALLEDYYTELDEKSRQYLDRIRNETQRMSGLIDDLLRLSRLTRSEIHIQEINLSELVRDIALRLHDGHKDRKIEWVFEPDLDVTGDVHLIEIMLTNLLSNAIKFTGTRDVTRIEFGREEYQGRQMFFIRDNGVGFDMAYAKNLFGVFQRMHRQSEFPGTGVGLATVQRIIRRHGGEIWAEARKDVGAVFYFTLEEKA